MGKISSPWFHLYGVGVAEFMGPFGYLREEKKSSPGPFLFLSLVIRSFFLIP